MGHAPGVVETAAQLFFLTGIIDPDLFDCLSIPSVF
jgi:hypothetical protein